MSTLYEYRCTHCEREWLDNERAMTLGKCQVCGKGEMKRKFSVPNLTGLPTRGSGKSDYRNRDATKDRPEDD